MCILVGASLLENGLDFRWYVVDLDAHGGKLAVEAVENINAAECLVEHADDD